MQFSFQIRASEMTPCFWLMNKENNLICKNQENDLANCRGDDGGREGGPGHQGHLGQENDLASTLQSTQDILEKAAININQVSQVLS